ncbi:hypothetical protein K9N50_12645 [bacterium]|nr:hypothetical protein [bacterium]
MADAPTIEELAEAMYKMVKDAAGKKQYKAMDIQKAMKQLYPGTVDKKMCKESIKILINSGRLVYTYFGGSFIELPHTEAAANPDKAE